MSTYYDEVPRCLDCDLRLFPGSGRGSGRFCHDCADLRAIEGFDGIPEAELVELHFAAASKGDADARLYSLEIRRRLEAAR